MALTPPYERFSSVPQSTGLYEPAREKDACGLAMVATLRGTAGHDIIATALGALRNLEHRGAVGSDAGTGDGAGIITQIPDAFLRAVAGFELPAAGRYAVGMAFLPTDVEERGEIKSRLAELAAEEELRVIGWRDVPVDPEHLGNLARGAMPVFEQVFVQSLRVEGDKTAGGMTLERQVYRLRKRAEHELNVYFPSLSARTLVYKGMVTTLQLEPFYPDLSDERFASRLALVHSRYSTNTFPSWPLAQPLRMIAHNGEINTVQGNRNWMRARQSQLEVRGARRHRAPPAHQHAGRERLGVVRRGRRTAQPRRTLAPARHDDDGPGGLREPGRRRPGAARLLRVPRHAHGAVGRSRRARVHRRLARRRHARPERPASRPLPRHRRRPRRRRERDRRAARPRSVQGRAQGPAAPRQDVPRRHRRGADHRGRRDQGRAGGIRTVGRVARTQPDRAQGPPGARAHRAHPRIGHTPAAHLRVHGGGGAHPHRADGGERRRAAGCHGLRHAHRGALRPAQTALRLLLATVRAGHQPAARLDPRRGGHLDEARARARAQPPGRHAGARQTGRARLPGDRQRRAREDPAHQAGVEPDLHRARPVPGRRRPAGHGAASRDDVRGGRRGDPSGHRAHRALRPRFHERVRTDSIAAHARHRAPPPHPRAEPHEGRPHRRGRRCARGAPRGAAHRLRRFGGQPVPGHGDGRGARAQRHDPVDLR